MDYSFFDGLIDSVFVISADKSVLYCNEPAATLCEMSVKRITKGKPIHEFIEFSNSELFVMPNGSLGEAVPFPLTEMEFLSKKNPDKKGKVQIAIHPFKEHDGTSRWVIMIRDVTLEEVLHQKYHKQLDEKQVVIDELKVAKDQLEDYSKNLEQKVEERTLEVKRANVMLSAIMNSLGQGFLVFDASGSCGRIYTKACSEVLESIPENQKIWDVLKFKNDDFETFKMWMQATFSESLPFDALEDLAPSSYQHSAGRHVRLEYYPLRDEAGKISNIVLVATDWTAEFEAQQALEKERKYAKMVIRLVTNKSQFLKYLETALATIKSCRKHVALALTAGLDHQWLFRALHTLEGESGTFSVASIWKASREPQELLEPLKNGFEVDIPSLVNSLVESLVRLEKSYNDFVAENAQLFKLIGIGEKRIELSAAEIESLVRYLQSRGVRDDVLNDFRSELNKEPVSVALSHYSEVVKQVSEKLGKPMRAIEWHGVDQKIHVNAYQDLFSSFVHAFRNAVDHGMETLADRESSGKPTEGLIQVKFEHFEKNNQRWYRFIIKDDGRGIDANKLRAKLSSQKPNENWDQVSDEQIIQHVFDSGVSTKDEVGEFSGRGIGLNAVKSNAESLGGKAWVETAIGLGTSLFVEVPEVNFSEIQKKSA